MKIKFTKPQILAHFVFWALVAWLAYDAAAGNLSVNPIQMAQQRTGRYALYFLVASLAITPLNTLFGWRQAIPARRPLGVYAFLWAMTHFTIFVAIDFGFQWEFIKPEILEKRYIIVGLSALTILTALALTSTKWAQKRMGKNWKRLHRLVYLAAGLVILHYAWAKKGDLFSLQGDIVKPLIFGVVVLLLLAARLPFVRRSASGMRNRLKRRLFPPQPAATD